MKTNCIRLLICILAAHAAPTQADDWPQWGGPKRDCVWRETGIVETLPKKLEAKWRQPLGAGYAGPSVAAGRVYVMDRQLNSGVQNPDDPFKRTPIGGSERVLALSAEDGKTIWKHEYPCRYTISYPSGPRATPTVDGERVYTLGAMGDFFCLDASSGSVLWKKNFVADYRTKINTWGESAAPLVDGENVIVLAGGKPGACVLCFDKATGKEKWRSLDADDFGYCAPTIIEAGGTRQLIIWTPDALQSLNPATGAVYWRQAFPINYGMTIPTPIYDAERRTLLVTCFYNGPMMMQLDADRPTAKVLWKGKSNNEISTDGLHSVISTPSFRDGYIYGVCSYGQLRCLEETTGKRIWETFQATGKSRWSNAFLIPNGDHYFLANENGELITAKLTPKGYEETSRAFLLAPTTPAQRARKVVWSHPAFAGKCIYARNDEEILCVDLAKR